MIAVIDVSGNNLTSLGNALSRLGFDYVLTHDAQEINQASHVILPGVGTAVYGMQALAQHDLVRVLQSLTQPLLGICLGMQLLLDTSEEGDIACLGLIPGIAKRLPSTAHFPVPHMGWNQLQWCQQSPLQEGLNKQDHVYFVHSYALSSAEHAVARCNYSETFSAIIHKDNVWGMQFHPEKSAAVGMTLLKNFCNRAGAL